MSYLLYTTGGDRPNLPGLVQPDDCVLMPVEVPVGPDGKAGNMWYFNDTKRPENIPSRFYKRETQTWRKLAGTNAWFGMVNGQTVTPESLLRFGETKYAGYKMPLNDGQRWDVPCQAELPCDFGLNDAGAVAKVPKNEIKPTYDRMTAVFEAVRDTINGQPNSFTDQQLIEYAGDLLCLNYRITWAIAAHLKLFDESTLANFLRFSTDVKAIIQLLEDREKGGRTDPEDSRGTASGNAA